MRRSPSRRASYEQFAADHADDLVRLAYALCGDRPLASVATPGASPGDAPRRAATRAVAAGVPVLAAVGLSVALATGSSSGSASHHGAGAAGGSASAPHGAGGPVRAVDAAADGSLENLGFTAMDDYNDDAPDGDYWSDLAWHSEDGSVASEMVYDWTPGADGKGELTKLLINPSQRVYNENIYTKVAAAEHFTL